MGRLIVFCDACVLYPAPIRDLLMELAVNGLLQVKWSERVHYEWINNLLKNRPDLTKSKLENTKNLMNTAILDCLVEGFDSMEKELNLPDPGDNHVLAAAIVSKSRFIVTYNLKDFPTKILEQYSISAVHPDDLFIELLKDDVSVFSLSIRNCHNKLKNPPQLFEKYLLNLKEKYGLVKMTNYIVGGV